ncbi:MAG: folX [Gammaproteobacteria bacterium]|jgi:FolB domain-containing protein|nr:folX [Gammaproteobacteria bacterium]
MKKHARISLHQLELSLSLGASETERLKPQIVKVDIDIDFPVPPQACRTDQLNETYCYDMLTQKIMTHIVPQSFCLLEHLAHEIYQLVKRTFDASLSIQVCVTKKPCLSTGFALAGASFSYGDN